MVNFLMSLLSNEDRKVLISELYEYQLGVDGDLDQEKYQNLWNKSEDLELKTLKAVNQ